MNKINNMFLFEIINFSNILLIRNQKRAEITKEMLIIIPAAILLAPFGVKFFLSATAGFLYGYEAT